MRVLAACLMGFVGLGALVTMAACSDSTDSGSGGAAGSPSSAGSSAKGGGTSSAGTGGAAQCGAATEACQKCLLVDNCSNLFEDCGNDAACGPAALVLPNCICNPSKDPEECKATFVADGGDPALKLVECFDTSCAEACQ